MSVLFCDLADALRDHPELVGRYLGTVLAADDPEGWSGGSFVYVPPGVELDTPLQVEARGSAGGRGSFERTLIVADEGSSVHYIEGCSAPSYTSDAQRSSVVEVMVGPSARVTHTTIQNWSGNVVSQVTKRAVVEAEGSMAWIEGHLGSRHTTSRPAVVLVGPKASGAVRSVAAAGLNQHHDVGAEMVHAASETASTVMSKSIAKDGGRTDHRSIVRIERGAAGCTSLRRSDVLVLDPASVCATHAATEIGSGDATTDHRASVSRVADEQLFYLQSRGLTEEQALSLIVNGFIEPVTCLLPMEYAVEWARLIELQMAGAVG